MVDWKKSFMNQHEFFDTRFDRYPYERKAGILKRTDGFFYPAIFETKMGQGSGYRVFKKYKSKTFDDAFSKLKKHIVRRRA